MSASTSDLLNVLQVIIDSAQPRRLGAHSAAPASLPAALLTSLPALVSKIKHEFQELEADRATLLAEWSQVKNVLQEMTELVQYQRSRMLDLEQSSQSTNMLLEEERARHAAAQVKVARLEGVIDELQRSRTQAAAVTATGTERDRAEQREVGQGADTPSGRLTTTVNAPSRGVIGENGVVDWCTPVTVSPSEPPHALNHAAETSTRQHSPVPTSTPPSSPTAGLTPVVVAPPPTVSNPPAAAATVQGVQGGALGARGEAEGAVRAAEARVSELSAQLTGVYRTLDITQADAGYWRGRCVRLEGMLTGLQDIITTQQVALNEMGELADSKSRERRAFLRSIHAVEEAAPAASHHRTHSTGTSHAHSNPGGSGGSGVEASGGGPSSRRWRSGDTSGSGSAALDQVEVGASRHHHGLRDGGEGEKGARVAPVVAAADADVEVDDDGGGDVADYGNTDEDAEAGGDNFGFTTHGEYSDTNALEDDEEEEEGSDSEAHNTDGHRGDLHSQSNLPSTSTDPVTGVAKGAGGSERAADAAHHDHHHHHHHDDGMLHASRIPVVRWAGKPPRSPPPRDRYLAHFQRKGRAAGSGGSTGGSGTDTTQPS